MQNHREKFLAGNDFVRNNNVRGRWDTVGSHYEFQLRFLQGLLERSEANNARIQNEITLVGLDHDQKHAIDDL